MNLRFSFLSLICILIIPLLVLAQPPQPPTTVYGKVVDQDSNPKPSFAVTARWVDGEGSEHTSTAFTLTKSQADSLGDQTLEGYYFFNQGTIMAPEGSPIELKVADFDSVIIDASPGRTVQASRNLVIQVSGGVFSSFNSKLIDWLSKIGIGPSKGTGPPGGGGSDFGEGGSGGDDSGGSSAGSSSGTGAAGGSSGSQQQESSDTSSGEGDSSGPSERSLGSDHDSREAEGDDGGNSSAKGIVDKWLKYLKPDPNKKKETTTNPKSTSNQSGAGASQGAGDPDQLNSGIGNVSNINLKKVDGNCSNCSGNFTSGNEDLLGQKENNTPENITSSSEQQKQGSLTYKEAFYKRISLRKLIWIVGIPVAIISLLIGALFAFGKTMEYLGTKDTEKKIERALLSPVQEIMSEEVPATSPEALLSEILPVMDDQDFNYACVLEAGKIKGTLSEKTILRKIDDTSKYRKLKVADVMDESPLIVEVDAAVYEAARLMKSGKVRKIPILNHGDIDGILTQTHVFDHMLSINLSKGVKPESIPSLNSVMKRTVVKAEENTPIEEALSLMRESGISSIVVVKSGEPIGIFTEKDFLHCLVSAPEKLVSTPIGKLMSRPVFTISSDISILDAGDEMLQKKYRHIVVVQGKKMVGVVSQTDLFKAVYPFFHRLTSKRFKRKTAGKGDE